MGAWHLTAFDGLMFVRALERELKTVGRHCALAGSVLHRGQSDKDVDIIVFPRKKRSIPRPNMRGMRAALRRAGLSPWMSRSKLRANWIKRGIHDNKWAEVWVSSRGRVGILVLS